MTNNDTTTLNGALQELGETMADNLTTMGVPSTYDEGLTTLAQKILSIGPTPPTPTPASIDLTGTKSILSYADSESCVLTATVLDSSDNPVEGVTVNLYNGSTLWDTLTTDSSGECSKTYSSAGSGDITFTAEVDGTLLTKTYELEDCKYWNDGSSVGSLEVGSNVSCTSNGSYITITSSTSGEKDVKLPVALTGDWEYDVTLAENLPSSGGQLTFKIGTGQQWGAFNPNSSITVNLGSSQNFTKTVSKDMILKITYISGVMTVYWNNEQLASKSLTLGTGVKMGYYTNSGRVQYLKNIKLKPL